MNILQMMPIFIPMESSGPMSDREANVFIGVWIILNLLWVISWLISIIRYVFRDKKYSSELRWGSDFGELILGLDIIMTLSWLIIILIWLGSLVAKFL